MSNHDQQQSANLHSSECTVTPRRLAPRKGQTDSTKLHVLKSKNGRSNGSSYSPPSKLPALISPTPTEPSTFVREVQNGQRPKAENGAKAQPAVHSQSRAGPQRAGSPPNANTARNTISSGCTGKNQARQGQDSTRFQANVSPFEAAEAQEQLESRHSNSDSDKSSESAGEPSVGGFVLTKFTLLDICIS